MVIKHEAYLDGPNITLSNVWLYIENRIKNGKRSHSYTLENGALYTLSLTDSSWSTYSLSVDTLYTIQPKEPEKPLQVYSFLAIKYTGIQLTANRVMITGICENESDFIKERFSEVWADMLKAFASENRLQPDNIIADHECGTITYKRNSEGQTIITGGAVNLGYSIKLGQGVSIKPEGKIRVNHTTGNLQPGLYPSQTKEEVIKLTSETLAGLTENVGLEMVVDSGAKIETKIQPRVPKQTKRLNDWKAAWRKVKGRWKGGSNYKELAELADVSQETIADIVKAGDAGLLD